MDSANAPQAPSDDQPARASIARVYDAALGGTDNFPIDRQVLAQVRAVAPEVDDLAWSNRRFLGRAVRFLADQDGIRQFLDCGSGLPTAENTHQIARRIDASTRVVYVDNDPAVIAHSEALLAGDDSCRVVEADIFRPADVLGNETVRGLLDLTQPLALLQVGTLHHYGGDDGAELMRQYVDALPTGSFVVVAHFFDPETDELGPLARRMEEVFLHSPMRSGVFRTRAEITGFLPGLEIVPPGPGRPGQLELCDLWWPDGPRLRALNPVQRCIAAGIGRKT
ncbi:S-adenosyl methyltransferase [Geodermatophilus africanus]|uniref:S-adenosyl methyltransferase n=1 Tax=Geodermatophilus africanus TaxID=1137993 RepID=A0A1H3D048_9ACTN|nr:SAM-dependent methyltransferase [Geodermatophilus africanus]SDX59059.1 S-adenosyl methyltransferase [Geodermatophilus africanus]